MSQTSLKITAALLCALLAACGGGGGGDPALTMAPAFQTTLSVAPADGAILCGVHLLEVRGKNMQRVELLAVNDGLPVERGATVGAAILVRGNTVARRQNDFTMLENGTVARLWFDVRGGNSSGKRQARITVFDAQGNQFVVAERIWIFDVIRAFGGDAARAQCAPFDLFFPDGF